uniref:Uncharacterized protein n=1 Tax=Chromera velia CCMP2878 TaxID=1169474 RepID=A0A0G4F4P5_9ALVE|eukprot:Cvel_15116.t1-p1 / transcript=Cvel_15116.t1 / gene=Cvel_15116 / organism=Chromera_velia_CCMP2878 / gene_product=hypothetical protein / transcript_product=hypothetical protein / location=Cvel_scaffold1103:16850-17170(+) / protein_length=107 / sequence_SO=supercontig / SO=protein_coding / is_pseudo=false
MTSDTRGNSSKGSLAMSPSPSQHRTTTVPSDTSTTGWLHTASPSEISPRFSLPVPPPPAAGPQRPRVVQAELDFNPAAEAQYYSTHLPLLNAEQRARHDAVMTALTQ